MTTSFDTIFRQNLPLLDVRAPIEFAQGAFPNATNLPILNDEERERIGLCYKNEGASAATALGHELVSGETREARINAWKQFVAANPDAHLYCFRGGQRSQIAEQWLCEAGVRIPRISGGYKALRRFLLEQLDRLPDLIIIAGKTGVGKTEVLLELKSATGAQVLDLEGHANHRGSAFGKRVTPQPSQVSFENAVAVDFLKATGTVFVEDEGRLIGRVNLPLQLQEKMKSAPIFLLEDSLEHRVARIHREYVIEMAAELQSEHPEPAVARSRHREMFLGAIDAIQKRLGGVRHREIRDLMQAAFDAGTGDDASLHLAWIERLLVDYYDPMYEYQLAQKKDRVKLVGTAAVIIAGAADIKLP